MRTRLQLPWLRLWLGLPRLFVRVVLLFVLLFLFLLLFVFLFVFLLLFVLVLVLVLLFVLLLLLLLLLLRVLDRRHYPTPGRRRSSVVGVRVRASWFMSSCSAAQKVRAAVGQFPTGRQPDPESSHASGVPELSQPARTFCTAVRIRGGILTS